ncbi:hypothetical protein QBC39DRAFT_138046 [Podospora conica]|nr:hypothetical protein QBC39DRAFT_138046 [Schizothecium conicum]
MRDTKDNANRAKPGAIGPFLTLSSLNTDSPGDASVGQSFLLVTTWQVVGLWTLAPSAHRATTEGTRRQSRVKIRGQVRAWGGLDGRSVSSSVNSNLNRSTVFFFFNDGLDRLFVDSFRIAHRRPPFRFRFRSNARQPTGSLVSLPLPTRPRRSRGGAGPGSGTMGGGAREEKRKEKAGAAVTWRNPRAGTRGYRGLPGLVLTL